MKQALLVFWLIFFMVIATQATCPVGGPRSSLPASDPLAKVLARAEKCPRNVVELKLLLRQAGLGSQPAMVANRGFHNSKLGSFSFFEQAIGRLPDGQAVGDGEFFFGHFTAARGKRLVLDQDNSPGKLLIELIVWDPIKGLFNFYELIGGIPYPQWFYRGDSRDALLDNQALHRGPPEQPASFGGRMRCSGCHGSGGPIMKELSFPHNDWWRPQRPLPLSQRPDEQVSELMGKLRDAAAFSSSVLSGLRKLESSASFTAFQKSRTLQESLRPLFCENEINLESAPSPLGTASSIPIPPAYWVHSFWGLPQAFAPAGLYGAMLSKFRMRFPETQRSDADHPWLVPVRSRADDFAIQKMLRDRIIDEEFVADVLSVDFENPVFSRARCGLLRLIPTGQGPAWKKSFLKRLKSSGLPEAFELARAMEDPSLTQRAHRARIERIISERIRTLHTESGLRHAFEALLQRRNALARSEISQNPRGQILEPGFRVIFPVPGF